MREYQFVLCDCWRDQFRAFSAALGDVIPPSVFSAFAFDVCPQIEYDEWFLDEQCPWAFGQIGVEGAPWIRLVPAIGFKPIGSYMMVDVSLPPDTYGLPSRTYRVHPIRLFNSRHPQINLWGDERQQFAADCLPA